MKRVVVVAKEWRHNRSSSPWHFLFQADIPWIAYNQVVKHLDIKHLSSLHQLPGDLVIFRRSAWITRRVIVCNKDIWAISSNRWPKYLCYTDRGTGDGACVKQHIRQDAMFGVKHQHPKLFVFQVHHQRPEDSGGIVCREDAWTLIWIDQSQAVSQLTESVEALGLSRTQSITTQFSNLGIA